MLMETVKIPEDRIRAVIGEKGKTKKLLEKECGVRLTVEETGVIIKGDPMNEFFAKDVIKAVGRGFSPRDALLIIKKDYHLHIFQLKEILKNKSAIQRMKARVIGEKGKIKKEIESATDSKISVYGNTIAVLSRIDSMEYAKSAVEKILRGAPHSSILFYLRKVKKQLFQERLR